MAITFVYSGCFKTAQARYLSRAPLSTPSSFAIPTRISILVVSQNSGMSRGYLAPLGCLPAAALAAMSASSRDNSTGLGLEVRAKLRAKKKVFNHACDGRPQSLGKRRG